LYAEVLKNKLEKEAKRMIPETQADFRRGRSTIDNIFVIILYTSYRGKETKKGENGKVFMIFTDLKAAFDKVNRGTA